MKQFISLILTAFMVLQFNPSASAQETYRPGVFDNLYLHVGLGSATNFKSIDNGLQTHSLECSLGYFLTPKVFAFANLEGGLRLIEQNDQNIFHRYQNFGLGLGWRFYKSNQYGCMDWRTNASILHGCNDWKNNEYTTGILWNLPSCRLTGVSLGLGYKYYHSKTEGINSRGGIFATIGFSL